MVKMNPGQPHWSQSTPYPPWDAVHKCPLWTAEEWKDVTTALSKLMPTFDVELDDDKVVVLRNTGSEATNEDDDDIGTKVLIAPVIRGHGVPPTFESRPYAAMCPIPCRLCHQ